MFSFMTPVYNGERYMAETLESVLKQTIPDWELILVVDEASKDKALELAQRYAGRDPRIRVFTVPHCNVAEKMNFALKEMRYNWVCGLDADDRAVPERLALVKAAIEAKPEVIAWGGEARHFNDDEKTLFISQLGPLTEAEFQVMRERGEPIMLNHCSMTFRRDIALEMGGYNTALHTCRYIWERRAAQLRGKALTWDEYQQIQGTHYPSRYFQQWAVDRSRFRWVRAGIAWGEKQYGTLAANLIAATILNPGFVLKKVRNQIRVRIQRNSP